MPTRLASVNELMLAKTVKCSCTGHGQNLAWDAQAEADLKLMLEQGKLSLQLLQTLTIMLTVRLKGICFPLQTWNSVVSQCLQPACNSLLTIWQVTPR